MQRTDLNNCDREPIHIPGKIQGHGVLIGLDEQLFITYCSENIEAILGVPARQLLGKPADLLEDRLFTGQSFPGHLKQAILLGGQQDPSRKTLIQFTRHSQLYNLLINKYGSVYLLEIEPEISNLQASLHHQIGSSLSEMLADKKLSTLLTNTAEQIKQLIGYDRVMVYQFHEDGHGEVVAEARNEGLDSWLGLHYPASDIPRPARELYKKNLVRLIADVQGQPAPILTISDPEKPVSLDLTYSELRAVSPVHIQYLKNMGVASSFSVSLIDGQELWGLIACHNYTPRSINFKQRDSAKLIGQVLSSAISFRYQEQLQVQQLNVRSAIEVITRKLLKNVPVNEVLFGEDHLLQRSIESSGAAMLYENQFYLSGITPDVNFIGQLVSWLEVQPDACFHSANLSEIFPAAADYVKSASGILACRLSPDLKEYIIWFRPEVIQTVTWAGNPEKNIEIDPQGLTHISPRHSFQAWSQDVKNVSKAWAGFETGAAVQIKDELNYSISRKATELRMLNEKLREAYAELDTFSYTISHDLKNPLTTIKSFSQLINREAQPDSRFKKMSDRILDGVGKMQFMIDEVLQYSRVGQQKITLKAINMQKILNDLRHDLLVSAENPELKISVGDTPEIRGDELMITQIFSNLVGNAVKYSGKKEMPLVEITGVKDEDHITYTISDNGVGIDPGDHDKIFELFSRSASSNGFEGTGVGLAIVKRILKKHQGRIWLESTPGLGSKFFVQFSRFESAEILN